jgi:GH25 family lysozyme M1 (1,4-beta-N-acetylmuramidase)
MQVIIPGAVNGLDVCYLQDTPPLNPQAIKDAGFEFVYVKSSQYSSTRDLRFTSLVDRLRKVGLVVGAYHFCAHDTDPVSQAEFFYKASMGLGSKAGELPPMADWEFCTPSRYPNHPQHCVDWIERFTDACDLLWYPENEHRSVPRRTVVYTYPNYAGTHQPALGNSKTLGTRALCYASYANTAGYVPISVSELPFHKVPKGLSKPLLVQYSGDRGAMVPGISVACDRQVFMGSREEWDVFLGISRPASKVEGKAAIYEQQRP